MAIKVTLSHEYIFKYMIRNSFTGVVGEVGCAGRPADAIVMHNALVAGSG